jgi:hypothetical protein
VEGSADKVGSIVHVADTYTKCNVFICSLQWYVKTFTVVKYFERKPGGRIPYL